jgi:type II secretory ATPase GspE/PulE/Tfp pilus assembly ATPase PilB-like protein
LVIAQRLVRKVCTSCVESYKLPVAVKTSINKQLEISGLSAKERTKLVPKEAYRGKGCKVCEGSGFAGQIGIFEIMVVDDKIKSMITENLSAGQIRKAALANGMISMFEDGLEKVQRGLTTIDEILRVTSE